MLVEAIDLKNDRMGISNQPGDDTLCYVVGEAEVLLFKLVRFLSDGGTSSSSFGTGGTGGNPYNFLEDAC